MSKYKVTVISPIHISSGNDYELNYNLLEDNGYIYLYDEFKLVEFFISCKIAIPNSLNKLKQLIQEHKEKIISSNLHNRKIKTSFLKFTKPLLEHISTANRVIIPGSSIKGAIRTSILDCLVKNDKECKNIISLCKDSSFDKKRFLQRFDNDLANIFKFLKISDSCDYLETKVYKTINVKKDKEHQSSRAEKVENISNYVEAITPTQTFTIEIKDIHQDSIFSNIGVICNDFYLPFIKEDMKHCATKDFIEQKILETLSNDKFLVNVGRFSGAELKSLNEIREIKMVKEYDKSKTTARTFGLEEPITDTTYFENALLPFGWLLFEEIDNSNNQCRDKQFQEEQKLRFEAIDTINNKISELSKQSKEEAIKKQKAKEEEARRELQAKAEREAKLASMSPLEKKIDELVQNDKANTPKSTLLLKAIKNKVFEAERLEALTLLKELLVKENKWKEKSTAKKPEKDKAYQQTLEVKKMISESLNNII